jgi:DNA polymerase
MLMADELGMTIVAHVHDEIVCEEEDSPDGFCLDDLLYCLKKVPEWAPGLFLGAAGYEGYYYKK